MIEQVKRWKGEMHNGVLDLLWIWMNASVHVNYFKFWVFHVVMPCTSYILWGNRMRGWVMWVRATNNSIFWKQSENWKEMKDIHVVINLKKQDKQDVEKKIDSYMNMGIKYWKWQQFLHIVLNQPERVNDTCDWYYLHRNISKVLI